MRRPPDCRSSVGSNPEGDEQTGAAPRRIYSAPRTARVRPSRIQLKPRSLGGILLLRSWLELSGHSVGRVVATGTQFFNCPHCNALYQLIKVEAGPETIDREIACRACGSPLPGREGKFVVKYFLLRKAGRRKGDIARAVKTLA